MARINFNSIDVCDNTKTVLPVDATGAYRAPVSAGIPGFSGDLYFKVNCHVIPAGPATATFGFLIQNNAQYAFAPPLAPVPPPIVVITPNSQIAYQNVAIADGADCYLKFRMTNLIAPGGANCSIAATVTDPTDPASPVMNGAVEIAIF